ncbi:hypothetical protein JZ751_015421, partial [Albula glossodonta]
GAQIDAKTRVSLSCSCAVTRSFLSTAVAAGATCSLVAKDGLTPLHCAARSGHDQTVELLLERGAPLLARTKLTVDTTESPSYSWTRGPTPTPNGFTPLHIACKKNRVKVMELLLKYGAIIQAITESGLTPIHVAAFMGHTNIILLLLQNGASPDIRNIRGETALHMAARAGQTEAEDQTPLHIASRLGKAEIVQLLLQHMAHPDASTLSGYTPLHISAREGQLGVASVLMEAGANNSLPTKEVALLLLDHGASPHAAVKNGYTPLHIAAKRNQLGVAEVLLRGGAGAGVLTRQGMGYTPLIVACHYGNVKMVNFLLQHGANVDATTKVVTEEVITKTTVSEDTMTGEGGEYLRPEDLQDLGDDSLPGQYLEGMNYMHISLDAVRSD